MKKKRTIIILSIIAIILLGIGGVFLYLVLQSKKADAEVGVKYMRISMAEAKEIFATKGDYIIMDVRTSLEYESGHIPGAVNVVNGTVQDDMPDELKDKNHTIYVYCRSGHRSKLAALKLVEEGYTNIIDCGGILDWTGEIDK